MARTYNIKWRDADRTAVSRAVQKFNAKITRVSKKTPQTAQWQPERLNAEDIRGQIRTRSDLQTFLRYVERYMKPGAEQVQQVKPGVSLTKFEIREVKIAEQRINRQKAALLKKLEASQYQLSRQQFLELQPIQLTLMKRPKDRIPALMQLVRSSLFSYGESYLESFKSKLLKAVERVFSDFPELEKYIKSKNTWDLFGKDWNPYLDFEFIYGPDSEEEKRALIERFVLGGP